MTVLASSAQSTGTTSKLNLSSILKQLIRLPGTPNLLRPVLADLAVGTATCRHSAHSSEALQTSHFPPQHAVLTLGTSPAPPTRSKTIRNIVVWHLMNFLPSANFNWLLFSLSCRIPCPLAASVRPTG